MTLRIVGNDTELDKRVLEMVKDPLLHLLRNAVDHGIEAPEERVANGKPTKGTIRINARLEGNNVRIDIRDDGRGMDAETSRPCHMPRRCRRRAPGPRARWT